MVIHKESLINNTGLQELQLPFESLEEALDNIIHVGLQGGTPRMWFSHSSGPKKKYFVMCIGTNHEFPQELITSYIGSVIVCGGLFVWHYFLVDGYYSFVLNPELLEKSRELENYYVGGYTHAREFGL